MPLVRLRSEQFLTLLEKKRPWVMVPIFWREPFFQFAWFGQIYGQDCTWYLNTPKKILPFQIYLYTHAFICAPDSKFRHSFEVPYEKYQRRLSSSNDLDHAKPLKTHHNFSVLTLKYNDQCKFQYLLNWAQTAALSRVSRAFKAAIFPWERTP